MKISSHRIFIQQWLELKPYVRQVASDRFYLQLSNNVKTAIAKDVHFSEIDKYLIVEDELNTLSCFLVSYLEDIASGVNIWGVFVKCHTELYQKPLPFYNDEEYYTDEINVQDVRFLIWYFFNTIQDLNFISPNEDYIAELAQIVYDVLDEAWDDAPVNTDLKPYYTIAENETDYFNARKLIFSVLFNSYLFYPDTAIELKSRNFKLTEQYRNDSHFESFLFDSKDNYTNTACTKLLAYPGKQWVAKILGASHPLHDDFLNLSRKLQGIFLYKGQNDEHISIEHIASGKTFDIVKKSLPHSNEFTTVDEIIVIGMVLWRGEWWHSGVYYVVTYSADLILDERNSIKSRSDVEFLNNNTDRYKEVLRVQENAFKQFTKGHQIVFLPTNKIDDFRTKFTQFYTDSLNLSKKEIEKSRQMARNEGFFGGEEDSAIDFGRAESGLVFFNPKSGVEIALNVNSAFDMPNNPFYKIEDSNDHILGLFRSTEMSTELSLFYLDNLMAKLNIPKGNEREIDFQVFDFLLRFWKNEYYLTKPSVTFIGDSEE